MASQIDVICSHFTVNQSIRFGTPPCKYVQCIQFVFITCIILISCNLFICVIIAY